MFSQHQTEREFAKTGFLHINKSSQQIFERILKFRVLITAPPTGVGFRISLSDRAFWQSNQYVRILYQNCHRNRCFWFSQDFCLNRKWLILSQKLAWFWLQYEISQQILNRFLAQKSPEICPNQVRFWFSLQILDEFWSKSGSNLAANLLKSGWFLISGAMSKTRHRGCRRAADRE